MGNVIKVLHVTSELDGGGIERLLYCYSKYMPEGIIYDYAICADREGILEKKCIEMGSSIYHYPRIRHGVVKTIYSLKKIMKQGGYDIVQVHADYRSFIALFAAKLAGVQVRIAHSHTCDEPENSVQRLFRGVFTTITKILATDLFACGEDAGKWVWGRRALFHNKIHIMHNAIEVEGFFFNREIRNELRKKLGVEGKYVIGIVGRLCYQKNQQFILNVLKESLVRLDNVILLLVGDGEDRRDLEEYVVNNELEKNVQFLGVRKDVNELLNAFDLFVLPSKYEGLPVSLIEVQANGLPAIVSDHITKEVQINSNIIYIPLEPTLWKESIENAQSMKREMDITTFLNSGYDIKTESITMFCYYQKLCQRIKKNAN